MNKPEYIHKRLCIIQCARSLSRLRSTSRVFMIEQMKRINRELDEMHKKNKKRNSK